MAERYTDTVLEHFMNPRNIGTIADPDGVGRIGDAECGDVVEVWIKVKNDRLADVKCRVYGCPAAVASCSMMTELAAGQTLEQARQLNDEQVAEALGGLPPQKMHCSNMAATVLHKAIDDYLNAQQTDMQTLTITTLINNELPAGLETEHGLAFWIEYAGRKILFDTGQSDALVRNAETLNIDLSKTDVIILSHGHYDHTGGLETVLQIAPNAAVYLHPDAAKIRYSCHPNKPAKNIAMSAAACGALSAAAAKTNIIYTPRPVHIGSRLTVTGPVPRITDYEDTGGPFFFDADGQTPDPIIDDQALLISTPKGLVVVLGCAHAGVVNTLQYAVERTGQSICAVIGGLHLRAASDERMDKTLAALKNFNIRHIIPCHCTGRPAIDRLQEQFGQNCLDLAKTSTLTL